MVEFQKSFTVIRTVFKLKNNGMFFYLQRSRQRIFDFISLPFEVLPYLTFIEQDIQNSSTNAMVSSSHRAYLSQYALHEFIVFRYSETRKLI